MRDDRGGDRLATVFGGSGFLGRYVVRVLARAGWRVRVACRRPDLAVHLQPLGDPGQIYAVQANVRHPGSIAAALRGAEAAVNLVGILSERGRQNFASVHVHGARTVAEAVRAAGVSNFVHVSTIAAGAHSRSAYARSKAEGEAAVRDLVPPAVILRPCVIFGPEDEFFNRLATAARLLPVLPLVGANTRLQPVFVDDVARAAGLALAGKAAPGATYELGGPEARTLRELAGYVLAVTERRRRIVPLSFATGKLMALATRLLHRLSLGLFPESLTMTRDEVELLRSDTVVSQEAKSARLTLEGLEIAPEAIEAIAPAYLYRFRKSGQYQALRLA